MTPEEKAKQLIQKFKTIKTFDSKSMFLSEDQIKAAVIITMDELISAALSGYDYDAKIEIPFYEKVKYEIRTNKKLKF